MSFTQRHWLKLFLKTGSIIGLGLFVLGVIGYGCGQWWAKHNLAPIVATELSKALKRPVSLGQIEDISLNRLLVKNVSIPANEKNLNWLKVQDITINYNLVELLFDRTLKLDIQISSPSIYASQDINGKWIELPPQDKRPQGPVKVEVGSVKIDDGQITIIPYSKTIQAPIIVSKLTINANIDDRQKQVSFSGGAGFNSEGQVQFSGESLIANHKTKVSIKGQKLDAAAATRIVKIPEVTIAQGLIDGSLDLAIQPQKSLSISSNLLVQNGKLIINHVPRSLDEINGVLQVSEREVIFKRVTTRYDQVPGVVDGILNYETGYQLRATTTPVTLPDVVKSINVTSPFPLAGKAVANLQLTGKLDRPVLTGKFKNSEIGQVDRVQLDKLNGNFKFKDNRITIAVTAQPKLGGKLAANGEIQLLKIPQTRFQLQGSNLSGDTLTRLYGAKLPPQVILGAATVSGTIGGAGTDIYTNLHVDAPLSTYPAKMDLQINPQGKTFVRSATILAAGGKVLATGEVTKTNWLLNLQSQGLDPQKLAKISGTTLPGNYAGKLGGSIRAAGLNDAVEIDKILATGRLSLELAAGTITANYLTIDQGKWQANISSDALDLQSLDPNRTLNESSLPTGTISGNFNLRGNGLTKITPQTIFAQGRGKLELEAGVVRSDNLSIANGDWQGIFTTDNLQLAKFNPQAKGKLSGRFNLAGNLQKFTPESIRGVGIGSLDLAQGRVTSNNFQIARGQWQGNVKIASLAIGDLVPEIPTQFRTARLDGNLNVAGDLQHLTPDRINIAGVGKLSLADGAISARQLEIRDGKWRGSFALDRLRLGSISQDIPDGFDAARLSANFDAAGDLTKFSPDKIQLMGRGELSLADGKIRANGIQLDGGNWRTNLAISNLELGSITDQLPSQFQSAKLNGNLNLAGNLDRLNIAEIQANGNGQLKLANGGNISAANLSLGSGQWQSDLSIYRLSLGAINPEIPPAIRAGLLDANLHAAGNLKDPTLENIEVRGNANISRILGGNIQLANLSLTNGQWQTRAIANRLNISTLANFVPNNSISPSQLNGQLTSNLQIAGNLRDNTLAKLQISGKTKLTNFRIGTLKFNPNLIGNIQANPGQGIDIALAGGRDRLSLSFDHNLQPQNFAIRQQGIIASGIVDRQILAINVERFPVDLFQQWIPKNVGIQQYRTGGIATGNLAINLNNFQLSGKQIEIINPIFGAFQGDRILANFRYGNGQFHLDDTEIQHGANSYLINASLTPNAKIPTFQAKIKVPKGSLEDVRDLLQIFSIDDLFIPLTQRKYGNTADLDIKAEKLSNRPQPLYNELRRLSELRRWLNREADRQQASTLIPELRNLQGDFSGEISLSSNPKNGISTNFDLHGEKWQLERYNLDQLDAKGSWRNGKLHLEPFTASLQASRLRLSGDFGVENQNAKINIENVPNEWLTSIITLPVDINGNINLNAQISGSLGNPRLNGAASLTNAQLNQTRLNSVDGNFNYWDGRLNFDSDATFAQNPRSTPTDRIRVTGSLPIELPFSLKPPVSNDIRVELNLENQGLQAIDAFSKKQLHWIDGQGKIDLSVTGKMNAKGGVEQLTASGIATIINGRIQSLAIPEPLREINGEIVFDFDRIDVRKLTGKFDKGQVSAVGIIPISDSFSLDSNARLKIAMKGVAIDLKEKYNGNVDGTLAIEGTAVTPILTGEIKLTNGQVTIPESANTASTVLGIKPVIPEEVANYSLPLRNLQLTLGENVQIIRAPILSFIATGKLDIDGTIDNPRPFGQVQLQKGSVNLFTTQFRLASGYPQTADFFPTLGTEPVVNLRLYAKALESTATPLSQRNSIARTSKGGEINETADFYSTSLGSVQTVQVEARISGLASQITQRLELTSTPPRSQPEILLLLGGGLVERLGAGSSSLGLGIANLAGSTLLNNIQDRISEALSLSDFRLFPTITKDSKTSSSSTFGVAAEVGFDLSPKVSTSVFKVLTNSDLPQYSLRYRLNEQTILRGSSNLFGENRAVVEFEQRF